MDNETNILRLSIKDLFTSKMLKYSLLPFVLSVIILYILFFVLAGIGLDQMNSTMQVESNHTTLVNGVPHTESFSATLQDTAIIKFLMSSAFTSWIATFLVYTIGSLLMLYFSIFVALIVIGFLTHIILKELQQRHYQDVAMIGYSNLLYALFNTGKWFFLMLLFFIVLIPFYFIPVLNIIAFNFPLYYFFHKMIHYDIASNICTKEEALKINFLHGGTLRLKSLVLYLISLIPFVIFFATVFFVIYLGHSYFLEVRKMRGEAH